MNRDFKDLRDKWIAHSVNAFEENDVLLWLMPLERGQMEIMDATVRERRVIRLSEEGMTNLKHHCDRILSDLEKRIGEAKIAALAAARALPLQDIYSRRFSEPSALGPESHSKDRKQRLILLCH